MSEPTRRPGRGTQADRQNSPASRRPAAGTSQTPAAPRTGRRDADRPRRYESSTIEKWRTPVLAILVLVLVGGGIAFAFASAAAPAYACSTIDTVQSPAPGELGQVQPDMGNSHVQVGDKVTYPVCPPASGHHINQQGFGPLLPKVYGPDDQRIPNGWVHNLEHGGLVLLYSCTKGACDDASIAALQTFSSGFPTSAVCGIPPGTVGPVIARFEEMPTRFAALVWDRALYLDTLDTAKIYEFFTRYGERLDAQGKWIAPPEPQCAAPTPSAAPSASAAPTPSPS